LVMASLLAATCAFTWVMPPAKPNPYVRLTRAQVEMKHAPPVERVESEGTICEFEEGKNHRPFLGVIESSKIKGSNVVYQVVDAAGSKHSVASKYLHCAFPASPMTKPNTPTSEVLAPYVSVARCKSTELGIDLEMLDLAWEVLAEEEPASLSSTAIVSYIDESLVEAEGPEQYRVFRLLTSDLGQIFFSTLHAHDYMHREYKPKSAMAVAASKESWCQSVAEGLDTGSPEWCFV